MEFIYEFTILNFTYVQINELSRHYIIKIFDMIII